MTQITAERTVRKNAHGLSTAPDPVNPVAERRPKTILFAMPHLGLIRYYETTLRILAQRGHEIFVVHFAARSSGAAYGERLARACPDITLIHAEETELGAWSQFARGVRLAMDYIRYFERRYRRASVLFTRVEDKFIPRWARLALWPLRLFGDRGVRAAIALLRRVEAAVPISGAVRETLETLRPDVVLVTPLVDWGSRLVDYVKAAKSVGIPTGGCVASWDNLTNKGHTRIVPDRLFVWNEPQREEATSLHGIPASNVVVTGAQLFDHLFRSQPERDRVEFCRMVGLDPARPFVVFVGSTVWIAPQELYFIERWLRHLRQAEDPTVASVGVLIRPHPAVARLYLSMDFSQLDNVRIWPRSTTISSEYFSERGQNELFDSLYHSAAVVGANTSALIDAGIVGRPVCTVRAPEFAQAQEGTIHFAHLTRENRTLLRIADDFEAHVRDLSDILSGNGSDREHIRAFLQEFVRPHGLERPAAPILADEIEAAAALEVKPVLPSRATRALRVVLYPIARLVGTPKPRSRVSVWVPLTRPIAWLWVRLVVLRISTPHWIQLRLERIRARYRQLHKRGKKARRRLLHSTRGTRDPARWLRKWARVTRRRKRKHRRLPRLMRRVRRFTGVLRKRVRVARSRRDKRARRRLSEQRKRPKLANAKREKPAKGVSVDGLKRSKVKLSQERPPARAGKPSSEK